MIGLPTGEAARKAGALALIVIVAAILFASGGWLLSRVLARPDPSPIVTARKDEAAAVQTSQEIGAATGAANRDTNLHVDITTKEIRDAFDAPAPPAATGAVPALPAAPVDRLRDRLNESIARANRAADASGAAD